MMVFIRILLLSMSMLGYIWGSRRWLKISPFSSYLFVFCNIALITFMSGILSLLEWSGAVVFIVGFILFIFFVIQGRKQGIKIIKNISIVPVAFVVVVSSICIILINTKFTHYENFSHWGVVVKYMLSTNAFPDASTTLIEFADYPLGASAFIYYICKIVGNSQGIMLFGQALLIFAAFYAMFDIIQEKKRYLLYMVLSLGLCMTSFYNLTIRMNNLLVDFLLPVLALGALAIIYSNRNNLHQACKLSIPILGLLSVVKNTGIFFVVTCLGYLIFVAIKQYKGSAKSKKLEVIKSCGIALLCSTAPLILWRIYFGIRFGDIATKFSISQSNLVQGASTKTMEQIQQIIHIFWETVSDISNPIMMAFLVINIIGVGACLVAQCRIKKKWYLWKVLLLTDLMVVVYYIGLLGMYIFLMPIEEALRLVGFERYICSIIIYQLGCLSFCVTLDIERSFYIKMGEVYNPRGFKSIQTKNIYQKATMICLVLAVMILISEINHLYYIKDQYAYSLPGRVSAFIEENKASPNENSYLVYASDKDEQVSSGYLQYILKYMLFTPNVEVIDTVLNDDFLGDLQNYDFLIIFENNKEIEHLLKKNFGMVATQGTYKIEGKRLQRVND